MRELYHVAGSAIHPALSYQHTQMAPDVSAKGFAAESRVKRRVLFLCTHNSVRSQMAETTTREIGGSLVEVYSAGTQPSQIHPKAVEVLRGMGIDASDAQSKHLNEYAGQTFDYIITVCDKVRETCPNFPSDPEQIHWSFPDPAAVDGQEAMHRAFDETGEALRTRIGFLLASIEAERNMAGGNKGD